ncbi:MAG: YmdB family metallophosphoesterase [Candidatus Riflebacteria bacterium]|nr:YmdB family metallophosphoesterase [Candidatus Riflebacteria bacterium]
MADFLFLSELLHQLPYGTLRAWLKRLRSSGSPFITVFLNKILLTEPDIKGFFDSLFDSGLNAVILGENAVIRSAVRDYLNSYPQMFVRPLNLPGKAPGAGAVLHEHEGTKFWIAALSTPNDRQPSDDPVKVFVNWIGSKQDDYPIFVFISGTDIPLKKAIAWYLGNLPHRIFITGVGMGNSANLLEKSPERFFALDIGTIGCEKNICGWNPEDWWQKFHEKNHIEYTPPTGKIISEYLSFSLDEKKGISDLKISGSML